jgi:hypothetical protein
MKSRKKRNPSLTKQRVFTRKQYNAPDGMLTSVWGPAMWHFLHMMSFNYPVQPTRIEKEHYRNYVLQLQYVLPCKYCRQNLATNFQKMPLTLHHMKNRDTFSKYIYELHEMVNRLLQKKSNLTYCDVRERYEHFRSRCLQGDEEKIEQKKKEKGCTEPLYGKKSKCIINIVPQDDKSNTIVIHKDCLKKKI